MPASTFCFTAPMIVAPKVVPWGNRYGLWFQSKFSESPPTAGTFSASTAARKPLMEIGTELPTSATAPLFCTRSRTAALDFDGSEASSAWTRRIGWQAMPPRAFIAETHTARPYFDPASVLLTMPVNPPTWPMVIGASACVQPAALGASAGVALCACALAPVFDAVAGAAPGRGRRRGSGARSGRGLTRRHGSGGGAPATGAAPPTRPSTAVTVAPPGPLAAAIASTLCRLPQAETAIVPARTNRAGHSCVVQQADGAYACRSYGDCGKMR